MENLPAMISGKVTSVEQLYSLADMKKSVLVRHGWYGDTQRLPAAVVINWQGHMLVQKIKMGHISIYTPKQKQPIHKAFRKHESGQLLPEK